MIILEKVNDFLVKNSLTRTSSNLLEKIDQLNSNLGIRFDIHRGPWLAGGSVLKFAEGRYIGKRDLDVFFSSSEQFAAVKKQLDDVAKSEELKKLEEDVNATFSCQYGVLHQRSFAKRNIYESAAAYTYSLNIHEIQIIRRRYYCNFHQLLGDFDFTVCMFATDGRYIAYHPQALQDMKTKTLRLHRVHKDSVLVKRFYKYIANGYTPAPGESRLMHEIVREEPNRYAVSSSYS